ncbi:SCO-spondin-like [Diadema antillarum]|uniref:SCO-spondin-like n=1 Tax=Diadema antillarum TaxID=105358 RepID=UPI003A89A46D
MLYLFTFLFLAGVATSTSESPADTAASSGTGGGLLPQLEWGNWSECSKSCGGGVQRRRLVCGTGMDLALCLTLKSRYRRRELREIRNCSDQICEVTGEWSAWEEWLPCSTTCGTSGFEVRFRWCKRRHQRHRRSRGAPLPGAQLRNGGRARGTCHPVQRGKRTKIGPLWRSPTT